jgi:hypothetical protein
MIKYSFKLIDNLADPNNITVIINYVIRIMENFDLYNNQDHECCEDHGILGKDCWS